MSSPPNMVWHDSGGSVTTAQSVTGVGTSGAIPLGTTSNVLTCRLYNNPGNVASTYVDATNVSFTVYDDASHQGLAVSPVTLGLYVQMKITSMNGSTTLADTQFVGIGGLTKHTMPMNSATLVGGSSNYLDISICVVVPTTATVALVTIALWVEYNATA